MPSECRLHVKAPAPGQRPEQVVSPAKDGLIWQKKRQGPCVPTCTYQRPTRETWRLLENGTCRLLLLSFPRALSRPASIYVIPTFFVTIGLYLCLSHVCFLLACFFDFVICKCARLDFFAVGLDAYPVLTTCSRVADCQGPRDPCPSRTWCS